jgi:hypothetical protein
MDHSKPHIPLEPDTFESFFAGTSIALDPQTYSLETFTTLRHGETFVFRDETTPMAFTLSDSPPKRFMALAHRFWTTWAEAASAYARFHELGHLLSRGTLNYLIKPDTPRLSVPWRAVIRTAAVAPLGPLGTGFDAPSFVAQVESLRVVMDRLGDSLSRTS